MVKSKAPLYDPNDQLTSLYARCLGHPARTLLLKKLATDGPCTVQQLRKNHPISQPTISQHLKILSKANLITSYERFPYTYYSVIDSNLVKANTYLDTFFHFLHSLTKNKASA